MFLLILDYESDAERKRIDYAIERWQSKLKISKPKGTIIVLDGKQEIIDDICSSLFFLKTILSCFYHIYK